MSQVMAYSFVCLEYIIPEFTADFIDMWKHKIFHAHTWAL
jgi:hypothetical protein